jgi:phage shock protein A
VATYAKTIGDHKIQLQQLLRDVEKIKAEAADTVADVITSKQERDLADMISGIAKDGSAEELQRMRQLRQEIKAEARISKEMAGTDTKAQEAEFLDYARKTAATSEFDALTGLAEKTETKAAPGKTSPDKTSALPE